jgi:predicted dehydrogenase
LVATGGIARTFVKDILIPPSTRGVNDIVHRVTAVASSSSVASAEKFIADLVAPKQSETCKAHGSYADLVADSNIDIVYIATPHSHHFQNAMLCLNAPSPKAILCEKALTVNAEQARKLYSLAKEKNVFFMEAVWTRFFPLSIEIRKLIKDKAIGEVLRVSADMSIGVGDNVEKEFDVSNRMVNKALAGGALLDLGIYSLTWVFQTLYHTLPREKREKPKVVGSSMVFEPRTGADESTSIMLEMPSAPTGKRKAQALATSSLRVDFDAAKTEKGQETPAVRIQGEKGEIQVYGPIYRPMRMKVIIKDNDGKTSIRDEPRSSFEGDQHGMAFEADECARCLQTEGKLESDTMGWEESITIMQTMDEARRIAGLTYPEDIESVQWPLKLESKVRAEH